LSASPDQKWEEKKGMVVSPAEGEEGRNILRAQERRKKKSVFRDEKGGKGALGLKKRGMSTIIKKKRGSRTRQ